MTKEQYQEMLRLKLDAHSYYGATVVNDPSEDKRRNKMYKKYMKFRKLYQKCKGKID